MSKIPNISEAEYQVIKEIWAAQVPVSTNEVVERLEKITTWKPKTLQTLLSRLTKKGALSYEKRGRVYVYQPLVSESDILEMESHSFLNRFFQGTLNSMVASFIERGTLSDEDLNALKQILDKKLSERR